MGRSITYAFESQLQSASTQLALFFEGEVAGTILRLWTGRYNLTWDNKTWLGNGWLHGVSSLKSNAGLTANGASVTLTGVPSELIAAVLGTLSQSSVGKLWLGVVGNDYHAATFTSANTERLKRTDNAALSITGNMTISAWVKATNVATAQSLVAKYNGTGSQRSYRISIESDSKANITVSADGSATVGISSSGTLSAATWYHLVGKYDGSNIAIIVDDGTPTTTAMTGSLYDSTADFFIGASGDGTTDPFGGNIRNVGIWSRALSADEITELYNNACPVNYADLSSDLKSNLVSYWDLDELSNGAGAVTRNDSHSTNDLTDENTVTSQKATEHILMAEPLLIFTGLLDVPSIQENAEAPILELTYESELIRLDRANVHRYTDEGQKAIYQNDKGFEYVAFLEQWNGYWGRQATVNE